MKTARATSTIREHRAFARTGPLAKAPWPLRAAPSLAAFAAIACVASCEAGPQGAQPPVAERASPGIVPDPLPTNCSGDDCAIEPIDTPFIICPSGSCDPGPVNGNGVYVVTEGNYCFAADGTAPRFCPEAFVNTPPLGTKLVLRDATNPLLIYEAPIKAGLASTSGAEQPVDVYSIRSEKGQLLVEFGGPPGGPSTHLATPDELASLRLSFVVQSKDDTDAPVTYAYELRLSPAQTEAAAGLPGGLRRYQVLHRRQGAPDDAWAPHCVGTDGKVRLASFLDKKRVDGLSAEVINDENATTMGCDTGAIDACLIWGYSPWNEQAKGQANADYLFGACLQAKRAAYFIGRGDPTSYTTSGTEIYFRDPFGIQIYEADPPEAIWGPHGAECINGDRLRRVELRGTLAIPPDIPRCEPLEWSRFGKLATSPDSQIRH